MKCEISNVTEERRLGIWEKYLTLWVAVCIGAGIGLGRAFPQLSNKLGELTVANISIPVAICLFLMIYPIMVQIDFGQIIRAGKTPKPIAARLLLTGGLSPSPWQHWALSSCLAFLRTF